jgi:serine/threonine protein kinase
METFKQTRGTMAYCDPEIVNQKICTDKSDVYSMGIVLWELMHIGVKYASPSSLPAFPSLLLYSQVAVPVSSFPPSLLIEAQTLLLVSLLRAHFSFPLFSIPSSRLLRQNYEAPLSEYDIPNRYAIMMQASKGLRPSIPIGCPLDLVALYFKCVGREPTLRPSALEFVAAIEVRDKGCRRCGIKDVDRRVGRVGRKRRGRGK